MIVDFDRHFDGSDACNRLRKLGDDDDMSNNYIGHTAIIEL